MNSAEVAERRGTPSREQSYRVIRFGPLKATVERQECFCEASYNVFRTAYSDLAFNS